MEHQTESTIPLYFQDQWIDVTEDVYSAYYQEWELVKYLRKKDRSAGKAICQRIHVTLKVQSISKGAQNESSQIQQLKPPDGEYGGS